MNTPDKDRLDDAIDLVSARMTAVRDDEAMTERIVAALPEASLFHWWLRSAWAPRLAAVALVAVGALLWNRNGIERPDPSSVSRPSIDRSLVAFAPVVVPRRPFTRPLERLEPLEPLEPLEMDFERSLPALTAMSDLSFESLSPRELPSSRDITLAPIEIDELPLPGDSIFPR